MKCFSSRVLRIGFITLSSLLITLPNTGFAQSYEPLDVSKLGDLEMPCGSLSQEALLMKDIITTTQNIKNGRNRAETGIGVAGAIGSMVVGTATGGIGLAAAGFLATHMNDGRKKEADSTQDIAAQRRSFLIGIYNAKGCVGPYEYAMIDPQEEKSFVDQIVSLDTEKSGNKYQADIRRRYND